MKRQLGLSRRAEILYLQVLGNWATPAGGTTASSSQSMYDIIFRAGQSYKFDWPGNSKIAGSPSWQSSLGVVDHDDDGAPAEVYRIFISLRVAKINATVIVW
jgi:hypothetical protein